MWRHRHGIDIGSVFITSNKIKLRLVILNPAIETKLISKYTIHEHLKNISKHKKLIAVCRKGNNSHFVLWDYTCIYTFGIHAW